MSATKRQVKKAALKFFGERFDVSLFDYDRIVRPGRGRARLWGVGVASAIYFVTYLAAYSGFSKGFVTEATLAKLVWIFIVPSVVIGSIVWLVFDSRSEYAERQRIARHVANCERDGGGLWRFAPVFEDVAIKGVKIEEVLTLSREGMSDRIDPQDYSRMVTFLHQNLSGGDGGLNSEQSSTLARNLGLA